ncbi:MAG: Nif3-like dinuclear metal center hexameric protein [Oscillospiraceae bacterium]|nr:Nif3-like dinuclear metal center hexameric protein [Oscillospiraceae bacterium]
MNIQQLYDCIDALAPFSVQEDWDNAGFLVGDMQAEISRVLLALDPSLEVIKEAKQAGAELLLTHHPVIFHAQKSFTAGNLAFEAARQGIAVLSAHTNYDAAAGGVNDVLASLLGLKEVEYLLAKDESQAMMRKGTILPCAASVFAAQVRKVLGAPVRFCLPEKEIKTVAVCGGAGGMFFEAVAGAGVDAFVTGDADHHEFLNAAEKGVALFAAGHFETEQPAVAALADVLSKKFPEVAFFLSKQVSVIEHI